MPTAQAPPAFRILGPPHNGGFASLAAADYEAGGPRWPELAHLFAPAIDSELPALFVRTHLMHCS
ncbi:MAG: hypothetical protein AAEC10_08235, partial [Rhodospirillales bacterium]